MTSMVEKVNLLIAFVVLHYNALNETEALINSIISRIDVERYAIIVVDNFSNNGSGDLLFSHFENNSKIDIIKTEKNLGFANGNNFGIDFCRNKYNSKFICCLNNDTLMIQKNFCKNLIREYNRSRAAVIGPRIILKNGLLYCSGRKLLSLDEYKELYDSVINNKCEKPLESPNRIKAFVKKMFPRLIVLRRNIKNSFWGEKLLLRKTDVILHGCCLIFTPVFFESLNGFDNRTFLYFEEELLYIMLKKMRMISVYNPSLKILHLEDAATKTIVKNESEMKSFVNKHLSVSLGIFIGEMENNKKSKK